MDDGPPEGDWGAAGRSVTAALARATVGGRKAGYVWVYEFFARQALSPARRPFPYSPSWPGAAVRPGRPRRAAGARRQAGPGDPAARGGHPARAADRRQGGRAVRGL